MTRYYRYLTSSGNITKKQKIVVKNREKKKRKLKANKQIIKPIKK